MQSFQFVTFQFTWVSIPALAAKKTSRKIRIVRHVFDADVSGPLSAGSCSRILSASLATLNLYDQQERHLYQSGISDMSHSPVLGDCKVSDISSAKECRANVHVHYEY